MTTPQQSLVPPPPAAARRPFFKRLWVVALGAALFGLIPGAGIGLASADPTTTSEYKALESDLSAARSDAADAEAAVGEVEAQLDAERDRTEAAEAALGDLPEREQALADAQAELDVRSGKLDRREDELARRERAVFAEERRIERGTVSGDGVYEIGVDITPGTYRTNGCDGGYYAILNSPDTTDIATNNLSDGPMIATLPEGSYFETSGGCEWRIE